MRSIWHCCQVQQRVIAKLFRQCPPRFLSDGTTSRAVDKVQDVEGGKMGEEAPEEGKLYVAERAKNLVAANQRFHLNTYLRIPEDLGDTSAVFSNPRQPVFGKFHSASCKPVIYLRKDHESDTQHAQNVEKLATASLFTGHIDPSGLVPVFTQVGLKPPVVGLVGDLVPVESAFEADAKEILPTALQNSNVKAYWFEWSSIQYIDLFDKRRQISPRDFRAAFIDYLATEQHKVIHLGNTKYFRFLPLFCKYFLGVPVDEAYLYSVDRIGMSVFAVRTGTGSLWREYRFPFTREIRSIEGWEMLIEEMISELPQSEQQS